jgi:uncharacterized protein (TIGR03118 family)
VALLIHPLANPPTKEAASSVVGGDQTHPVEVIMVGRILGLGLLGSLVWATLADAREPFFKETDLVSDIPGRAMFTDPDLRNPWGLAASPSSPFWVADNGTGLSTLYNGQGIKQQLRVTLEGPDPQTPAAPTGLVFNIGTGKPNTFFFAHGGQIGQAVFIWSTEDGFIEAWNPGVGMPPPPPPLLPSEQAFIVFDNSTKGCNGSTPDCGSVYKGLAIATTSRGETRIYATDFRNNRVDIFDDNFASLDLGEEAFDDDRLPHGYAPFGIAELGGHIFVTYAKQDVHKHDDVSGQGHGFVDEYDLDGRLLRRVASRGVLNSPWGLAIAPSSFGKYAGDLIIGNFGDGRIHVFRESRESCEHEREREHEREFRFVDAIEDDRDRPIVIDGLWSLVPGNNAAAGTSDELFFTAGINGEANGLFGKITRKK